MIVALNTTEPVLGAYLECRADKSCDALDEKCRRKELRITQLDFAFWQMSVIWGWCGEQHLCFLLSLLYPISEHMSTQFPMTKSLRQLKLELGIFSKVTNNPLGLLLEIQC